MLVYLIGVDFGVRCKSDVSAALGIVVYGVRIQKEKEKQRTKRGRPSGE